MTVPAIETTRLLRETSPHIGILMLTMFEDDESISPPCEPVPAVTC